MSLEIGSTPPPPGTWQVCICRLPIDPICIVFVVGLPLRAIPNHKMGHSYVKKRPNGRQISQKALHVLCPIQWLTHPQSSLSCLYSLIIYYGSAWAMHAGKMRRREEGRPSPFVLPVIPFVKEPVLVFHAEY